MKKGTQPIASPCGEKLKNEGVTHKNNDNHRILFLKHPHIFLPLREKRTKSRFTVFTSGRKALMR
jgi:hypothetical protein